MKKKLLYVLMILLIGGCSTNHRKVEKQKGIFTRNIDGSSGTIKKLYNDNEKVKFDLKRSKYEKFDPVEQLDLSY